MTFTALVERYPPFLRIFEGLSFIWMFSKTFPIANYFMYVPEHLLDSAEQLILEDKVALKRRKNSLWIFDIEDDEDLEVEVLTGRKQVKSFTCDCGKYQEHGICIHVVAAIRKIAEQTASEVQEKKKKAASTKKSPTRYLQTRMLLEEVSERDLREFVRNYAQEDDKFALRFKARFAHHVQTRDDLAKYFSLIKKFDGTLSKSKLNATKLRRLNAYIEDLLALGSDLGSKKDYREAFSISYGCLKFLIYKKEFRQDEALEPLFERSYVLMDKLFTRAVARDLLQKMQNAFVELGTDASYEVTDHEQNIFSILFKAGNKADKKGTIEALADKVESNEVHPAEILTLLKLYVESDMHTRAVTLISNHADNFSLVRDFLNILLRHASSEVRGRFAEIIYRNSSRRTVLKLAHEHLFDSSIQNAVKEDLTMDLFLRERKPELFQKLKEVSKDWDGTYQNVIDSLARKGDKKTILQIWEWESNWDLIKNEIASSEDVELILDRLDYLKNDPEWLRSTLTAMVTNRLRLFIGLPSVDYVRHILNRLEKERLFSIANDLKQILESAYSERTILMKTLKNEF